MSSASSPSRGRKRRKRLRLADPLRYERRWWSEGVETVAGVDEVGRGPLAGPIVAAAVVLPRDTCLKAVTDSKDVPEESRAELAAEIRAAARAWGLGAASNREIDRLGIAPATALALDRALDHLGARPGHIVVDGRPMKALEREHHAVVKADYRIHCVACASILAKVCRDDLMERLDRRWPGYGWARNKGYGTEEHRRAIAELGTTPHHRVSFNGVE